VLPKQVLGAIELRLAHASTHAREAMLLEVRPDACAVGGVEPTGRDLRDP